MLHLRVIRRPNLLVGFLIVLFHGFRSSLHLSARWKTPHYLKGLEQFDLLPTPRLIGRRRHPESHGDSFSSRVRTLNSIHCGITRRDPRSSAGALFTQDFKMRDEKTKIRYEQVANCATG